MKERIKNYKLVFFSFVFLFLVLTFSSAQEKVEIEYTFKQGDLFDIKRSCFNNGTYCSDTTICNFTAQNMQNGDLRIDNQEMTNQLSFYNYSLGGISWDNGIYQGTMVCKDGTGEGSDTFFFQITPSGQPDNSIQNIILLGFGIIFSIGLIILGFGKQDPIMTLFGSIGLTLLGIYTMVNGISIYRNNFTQGISTIVIFFGGYVGVRTAMEMLD